MSEGKRQKMKSSVVELFDANLKLESISNTDEKYKLEIIKIEQEERVNPPPEDKDNILFGWQVETRERADGKTREKFYRHKNDGKMFRSKTEVINYILHGNIIRNQRQPADKKDEKAKKPKRPSKKVKKNEDEAETSKDVHQPKEAIMNLDECSFQTLPSEAVMEEFMNTIYGDPEEDEEKPKEE